MKLSWLPDSYQAAVAITDDPDNGDILAFKTMYDFLMSIDFPTTRAMWVYKNAEPTGTPPLKINFTAPLLTESECLDYCKVLTKKGFEICLHGASSGNNNRFQTIDALNFLAKEINPSSVYICHSKNAENLYWDVRTANSAIEKKILQLYTKNICFGEVVDSPYFWGDICREKIRFIRMFRTRAVNTLSFNPSMPYHDFSKPFVNFWFSATKGYIPTLFTESNIDKLCEQHGASILYQYMHKYIISTSVIKDEVKRALERVAGDSRILKKPASFILERLKSMQNVLIISNNGFIYLINASRKAVESVQIDLNTINTFSSEFPHKIDKTLKRVIFDRIDALSFIRFKTSDTVFKDEIAVIVKEPIGIIELQKATVYVNFSEIESSLQISSFIYKIQAAGVFVKYKTPEAERLEILKEISLKEVYKLKAGQMAILLREHLFLGRKFSTKNYLQKPGKIEDLSNW